MRASQDEDRRGRGSSPQPFAVISKSRCQTAHLVPAAHFCVRGLQLCFTHPEQGVGGAPIRRPSTLTSPQVAPGCFTGLAFFSCALLMPPLPSSENIVWNWDRAWGSSDRAWG